MDSIYTTYKETEHIYTTRSIKKIKLLQITMEFQKGLIALQNQTHSFFERSSAKL